LASEYGGGPRAILDGVYPDELFYLARQLTKRRAFQWRMWATIASFPSMEKEERKDFLKKLDQMGGEVHKNKLDEGGFAALKLALSQNSKFIVR